MGTYSYINSSIQWRHREKAWWCGHLTRPSRASLDTRRKKLFQLMGNGTPFLENSLSFHSFSCPATTSETAKWWRDMSKQNVWHYVNVYLSPFLSFLLLLFYSTSCSLSLSLSLLKKKRRFRILEAFRWGVQGLPGEKIAMVRDWLTFTGNSYTICFILPHGLQH